MGSSSGADIDRQPTGLALQHFPVGGRKLGRLIFVLDGEHPRLGHDGDPELLELCFRGDDLLADREKLRPHLGERVGKERLRAINAGLGLLEGHLHLLERGFGEAEIEVSGGDRGMEDSHLHIRVIEGCPRLNEGQVMRLGEGPGRERGEREESPGQERAHEGVSPFCRGAIYAPLRDAVLDYPIHRKVVERTVLTLGSRACYPAGMLTRLAVLAALLLLSSPARAASGASKAATGWTAVQESRTEGSQIVQTAQVTYGHHHLRIDSPEQRLILDLASGDLTVVNLAQRTFAQVTLTELVALRETQEKKVRKSLNKMPPEIRAQMEAQLADAARAAHRALGAKDTGETAKQGGLTCSIYAWTTDGAAGTACVAQEGLPFDASAFRQDSLRLARKMSRLGAGNAATSMAVLQLGEHGFPLFINQTMNIGAQQLKVSSTFRSLARSRKKPTFFQAPSGFSQQSFEAMMREAVNAAPSAPASRSP